MGRFYDSGVSGSEAVVSDWEPKLNMRLGRLLSAQGIDLESETRRHGRQIDIRVRIRDLMIAVEAEIGKHRQAIKDAQARLDQDRAQRAVAVSYPAGLTERTFDEDTEIEWTVLPDEAFTKGTPSQLAATLRRISEDHGNPDTLAEHLMRELGVAVDILGKSQREMLAKKLDLPIRQWDRKTKRWVDRSHAAAKRALLVITAAAMFHARLDLHLHERARPELDAVTGDVYTGEWPPATLQECLREGRDHIEGS